jgi:uncharacterized protein YndB with AHSA1/START domain
MGWWPCWPQSAACSPIARYHDIVANERIVYAYEMMVEDQRISVSVATFELTADGKSTRLVLTEQGAYFDGGDGPKLREQGTRELLEALGRAVESQP